MASNIETGIKSSSLIGNGFWSKLGIAMCLALLLVYGVLWGGTVQGRGGPDVYVRLTDFLSPLTGATILAAGRPEGLYDLEQQRQAQEALLPDGMGLLELLPYNHPPFSALLIEPLIANGVPVQAIFTLWTLLSAAAAGISLGALAAAWPGRRSSSWLLMLASTSFFPLIATLMQGQSTALILLGWAGAGAALKNKQQWLAGCVLTLSILKPQTLPILLAALLFAGYWKTLAAFLATTALAVVAVMPFVGVDWPLRYARLLIGVLNAPSSRAIAPEGMPNLRGLFSTLFGTSAGSLLAIGAVLVGVGLMALLWRGGAARRASESSNWDMRLALTMFVAMLTSLHANGHDLALAIVPGWIVGALLAGRALPDRHQPFWVGWIWLGYSLPILTIPGVVPTYASVIWLLLTCAGLYWELPRTREQEAVEPDTVQAQTRAASLVP